MSDAERNGKLMEKFKITVFPTMVVTDPKGRPFGMMEDYKINGINPFMALMDKWDGDRKALLDMLAKTDKDGGDAETAGRRSIFSKWNDLGRFYGGTLKKLAAKLPNGEHVFSEDIAKRIDGRF